MAPPQKFDKAPSANESRSTGHKDGLSHLISCSTEARDPTSCLTRPAPVSMAATKISIS
jgi:hypothetical protein